MALFYCYKLQPFEGLASYMFVSRKQHSFAGTGVKVLGQCVIKAPSALGAKFAAYSKIR